MTETKTDRPTCPQCLSPIPRRNYQVGPDGITQFKCRLCDLLNDRQAELIRRALTGGELERDDCPSEEIPRHLFDHDLLEMFSLESGARETMSRVLELSRLGRIASLHRDGTVTDGGEDWRCQTCLGTTRTCSQCERPEAMCGCVVQIPLDSPADWVSGFDPVICPGCGGTGEEPK